MGPGVNIEPDMRGELLAEAIFGTATLAPGSFGLPSATDMHRGPERLAGHAALNLSHVAATTTLVVLDSVSYGLTLNFQYGSMVFAPYGEHYLCWFYHLSICGGLKRRNQWTYRCLVRYGKVFEV